MQFDKVSVERMKPFSLDFEKIYTVEMAMASLDSRAQYRSAERTFKIGINLIIISSGRDINLSFQNNFSSSRNNNSLYEIIAWCIFISTCSNSISEAQGETNMH